MDSGGKILNYFLRNQLKETLPFLRNAFGDLLKEVLVEILKDSDFSFNDPESQVSITARDVDMYLLHCGFSPKEVIEDVLDRKTFINWIQKKQTLILSYVSKEPTMQNQMIKKLYQISEKDFRNFIAILNDENLSASNLRNNLIMSFFLNNSTKYFRIFKEKFDTPLQSLISYKKD